MYRISMAICGRRCAIIFSKKLSVSRRLSILAWTIRAIYTRDRRYSESQPLDYRDVLREFQRLLAPGGRLFLTVPYGKYQNFGWLQQFDPARLADVFQVFDGTLEDQAFYRYTPKGWVLSNAEECAECEYYDFYSRSDFDADYAAAARRRRMCRAVPLERMLRTHDDARRYYYFVRKLTPRNQWLLFLVRYTWQCLKQFYYYVKVLERAKADAIMSGFWAGITGRYGAERIQAPRWLWRSAYYSMNAGYRLVLSPFRSLRKRFSKRTLPFGTNEVLQ